MIKRLHKWLGIHTTPVVKVYQGFGHQHHMVVFGHVFAQSPLPQTYSRNHILRNMLQLLRLFFVKPLPGARVQLQWHTQVIEATTEYDGFFKLEWSSQQSVPAGTHNITVAYVNSPNNQVYRGLGSVVVPHITQLGIISDIDDTFLVSHSASIFKRLLTLFTLNAQTRKAFEGVVRHYKLLEYAQTKPNEPNPFFYVSSSEWNLYDYLQEFILVQQLPRGIFLLNQIKRWYQLLKTGKTKHEGKFARVIRIMEAFPNQRFILLGDNSQRDPDIYSSVARHFPQRVVAVYIRMVVPQKQEAASALQQQLNTTGIPCCLFTHSETAVNHSLKIGLIPAMSLPDEHTNA
jgi:phosphatidate phosphatase APP1